MRWIAPPEKDAGTKTLGAAALGGRGPAPRQLGLTAQQLAFASATANGIFALPRDLLLPRLMSGKLSLPDAEETVAASL